METAARWKPWKNKRPFFHRFPQAWKTLRPKHSEFPTVPTASAAALMNIFRKAGSIIVP